MTREERRYWRNQHIKLAAMSGYGHELGRVVDKLTRDRMVSLRYKEDDGCI